ncbi:ribosome assembly protein 4 [Colletotrichum plurivorum]|uniref:Ribosome assembly protein 4 n=1 Tax=Colletotrichum plurivorum TaxID=2175906 RepID=A0A8H6N8N5_9PEZI|nr:ribosome assembly protein 4 [Colletotrichum plurivorum]
MQSTTTTTNTTTVGSEMDELIAECRKLQSTLAPAVGTLHHFIAAHPGVQAQLSPLLDELFSLPDAVAALEKGARACAQEQGLLVMMRSVPDVCVENIRQIEAVLLSDPEPGRGGRDAWRDLAAEATILGTFLGTGRRALGLATDALDLVWNLRAAELNGESPPYAAGAILQEISAIQRFLDEQTAAHEDERRARELHGPVPAPVTIHRLYNITFGGLFNYLKTFFEQQSGTRAVSEMARSRGFNSGSATPDQPQIVNPPLHRVLPSNLIPPAPSDVTFRHVGKITMNLEKEPLEVKFLPRPSAPQPQFAVSNFHRPIAVFDAASGQRRCDIKAKGVNMVFSPQGDAMALTVEHIDDGPRAPKLIPFSHDFERFERPALYVFDVPQEEEFEISLPPPKRRFALLWHGVRAFCFSPDGSLIAIRGVRNRVELIAADSGSGRGVVRSHTDEVTHAAFAAGGEKLVTMSRDGTLRVTHVGTMRSIAKLEMESWRNPLQLAVSLESNVIASIWGRTVTIWDSETGVVNSYNFETARGSEGWPLAISPDLRFVASRTDDGADVAELATGRIVYSARLETGFVVSAAFSPDGKYLVCGRCANGHHGRPDSGLLNMWEIQS